MELSERNKCHLALLKDVYEVSEACGTRTYIWAGLVRDVLAGEFLREHGDVDGFTLNLWALRDGLAALYRQRGYAVSFLEEVQFLQIARDGVHATINRLDLDGNTAMWRHIGDQGTVYFPRQWLSAAPHSFYDVQVFVSGIEFEVAIVTHPHLLGPEWEGREKDVEMLEWLNGAIEERGMDREAILKQVWSYNPYWVKREYTEYSMPSVAWRLEPGR